MSQSFEKRQNDEKQPGTAAPTGPQEAWRPQVQIADSKVTASYSNFCRVTGAPEELIIDFGINPQPFGVPTAPIAISGADTWRRTYTRKLARTPVTKQALSGGYSLGNVGQ
jgi:hypothetical protein